MTAPHIVDPAGLLHGNHAASESQPPRMGTLIASWPLLACNSWT
jgi:hypothetical protein